jgi:chromate reductase, NAD(P)H dehydrogenase (quinone)
MIERGAIRIIGIAGSLRKQSFNAALLRAARELADQETDIEIASISDIPLYNFDVEEQGIPHAVAALKEKVANADGLLIATPENNNSIPGVAKNAIDWMTRPSNDIGRVFYGLPIALIGASTGTFGTVLAQTAWLPVLRTLRTKPWFGPRVAVPHANTVFDENGRLTDEATRRQLQHFVLGFSEFVREQRRPVHSS